MTDKGPDLDELVEGIRRRSETAFAELYRLTASGLLSFAFGMLRDRAAAEDAVQQAFLELTRAGPGLRGDGRSLRAWLYRSVRFTCLDELRRRRRRPETPTPHLPEVATAAATEADLDPDLRAALMALTERQRAIVLLRHVAGMSGKEVADVVGGHRAAVYAASARAERRLASLLGVESSPATASSSTTTRPSRKPPS